MMMSERLLTPAELGDYLHISTSCVWSLARENKLPHVRIPGGRRFIRFDLEQVLEALAPLSGEQAVPDCSGYDRGQT